MAATPTTDNGEFGFQIAPMVDVVFVLLLFFIACVGMKQIEKELLAPIPRGFHPEETLLAIDITSEGKVLLNDQPMAGPADHHLAGLKKWFADAHAQFGEFDPVVIGPADDTRHERVMEVLAACRSGGVTKLAFR